MTDYGPKLAAARLYEKRSAKGNTYFTGRWGALRVAVLKTAETGDDGSPIWSLVLSEAPTVQAPPAPASTAGTGERARRDYQRPLAAAPCGPMGPSNELSEAADERNRRLNDPIPF